jgi:hypothetical protein
MTDELTTPAPAPDVSPAAPETQAPAAEPAQPEPQPASV